MHKRLFVLITALFIAVSVIPTASAAGDTQGSLKGKVIILDPGHGFGNTNTYAGYDEQAAMLKLALKIKPLLESRGATVHMTRPTQSDVSLYARAAMINMWALQAVRDKQSATKTENSKIQETDRLLGIMHGIIDTSGKNASVYFNTPYSSKRKINSDLKKIFELENDQDIYNNFLVISLHSNATATPINTSANGADIYIATSSNSYFSYSNNQRSSYFGKLFLDNINKLGIKRNKINNSNLFMVREHNLPGVLIENGFHTNKSDRAMLLNDAFLDKLAITYADTISDYFGALR